MRWRCAAFDKFAGVHQLFFGMRTGLKSQNEIYDTKQEFIDSTTLIVGNPESYGFAEGTLAKQTSSRGAP